jgi:hypothetical protein
VSCEAASNKIFNASLPLEMTVRNTEGARPEADVGDLCRWKLELDVVAPLFTACSVASWPVPGDCTVA